MKLLAIALSTVVLALVALPALADAPGPAHRKSHPTARRGKPSAPVDITAQLGATSGTVTLHALSAAKDVTVHVRGVDGMSVTSAETPVAGAQLDAGQTTAFDVAFTPGPGRSTLVVAVNATFNGVPRSSVVSFAVGTPTPEQRKSAGTVRSGPGGQRIKTLPAETK